MLSLASEGFGKVCHSERSKGFSRDHKISHFGGIKEGKYLVVWRDFPYASALFGFQGKIACSNFQGISIYPPGNQHIPQKWHFEDDFPFPQVGYVNPLKGTYSRCWTVREYHR